MSQSTDTLIKNSALEALSFLKPRPALGIGKWAERERVLGKGVTAKPGKFHCFPYQVEPQETFRDPDVMETVLLWASRLGKTEIILNAIGYCIEHDPMSQLILYPTEDSAEKFSKKFLNPLFNDTPCLCNNIAAEKSRDGGNTILNKSFTGGTLSMVGSNSPSKLRQVQAPLVICDEIDAMLDGPEGDPVDLAFKRSDNYPYSINISSSTPTIKGGSRIETRYLESDQRKWFVPCQNRQCGEPFVMLWDHVDWKQFGSVEDPVILCPFCNHPHDDDARLAMVNEGFWQATAAFFGVAGYWLNGLNTLMPAKKGYNNRLHQMVSNYRSAKKKGQGAVMVFKNTTLAETYEEKSQKVDHHALAALREIYKVDALPNSILLLSAGVDTQPDRFEVDVWGFGIGEESWHVETAVISGDPKNSDTRNKLDEYLSKSFQTHDGRMLPIYTAGIDSGGNRTKSVYEFARGRAGRRIFALKGASTSDPFDSRVEIVKQSRNKHTRVALMLVHVSKLKKQLYDRLKETLDRFNDPEQENCGQGHIHFSHACGDDFFRSLTAEKLKQKLVNGKRSYYWAEGDYERNERLDNAVYAYSMILLAKPNWVKLKANAEAQRPAIQEKPEGNASHSVEKPKNAIKVRKRGGSWATKF